jgi:site-specific recombinase XerD
MDAIIHAAKQRQRPRDLAILLILRYTGMRRESVATLRLRHLDPEWGLRNVRVKGGKTRDIPLSQVVTQFLQSYVKQHLPTLTESITPDTPGANAGRAKSGGPSPARTSGGCARRTVGSSAT